MQHAALSHWYLLLCIYLIFSAFLLPLSIPFLYFFFFSSGSDKPTEWSTIPACPSFTVFFVVFFFGLFVCLFVVVVVLLLLFVCFNRGNFEGTNSSKILCLMFLLFFFCFFLMGLYQD